MGIICWEGGDGGGVEGQVGKGGMSPPPSAKNMCISYFQTALYPNSL